MAHTVMRRFRKKFKSRAITLWCLQIVNRGWKWKGETKKRKTKLPQPRVS